MAADISIIDREEITNGSDTLDAFAWLRQAKRVCVDNSVLHHYLMRKKSVSRIYLPNRFKSNTVLHQDAMDFLSQYGSISQQNLHFLHIVYANAVHDTLGVLWDSVLSPDEKLREYCTIALHPTTCETYLDTDQAIDQSRETLLRQMVSTAAQCAGENDDFPIAIQKLRPRCGGALSIVSAALFVREKSLMDALMEDDPDRLTECLLDLIAAKKYTKQYDLAEMLQRLAHDKPPLQMIDQLVFLRKYREIYWAIWQGKTLEALDEMTGMLLEERVRGAEDPFLQLYVTLAAMLEQAPAFLFGKVRMARLYLRQDRRGDCRTILDELSEMGVESDETAALRAEMEANEETS